jgi:hypothetical protein
VINDREIPYYNNKRQKNPANPGEKGMRREESDFQSYYIFNKNHKAYKETGKYCLFKGRKKLIEIFPEKTHMTDL